MEEQDKPVIQDEQNAGLKLFAIKIIFLVFMMVILSAWIPFWILPDSMMKPRGEIHSEFKFFLSDPIISKDRNIYMLNRQLYSFQVTDYEDGELFDENNPKYTVCGVYSYALSGNVKDYNQENLIYELNDRLGNEYNFETYQDDGVNRKWREIKYIRAREFQTLWFPIKYLNNLLIHRKQVDKDMSLIPRIEGQQQGIPIPRDFNYMIPCISTMSRQDSMLGGYIGNRSGREYHRFLSDKELQQERERILRVLSAPDTIVRVDMSKWLVYFYNPNENRMVVVK
ncbi:hypothetical protein H9Q10_09125 [Eikenella sp. S3360]|uniref:Uncharacterized protein n=1 Tax=Eikenella glucosivorans TaxID=2766967 RepID=A0ABS0NC50_9NEIS|nr:hypothetical protein [Eikenella glucosivorans]MBH5329829.1 hypothetical protein [Eikenella glucosivorans]